MIFTIHYVQSLIQDFNFGFLIAAVLHHDVKNVNFFTSYSGLKTYFINKTGNFCEQLILFLCTRVKSLHNFTKSLITLQRKQVL